MLTKREIQDKLADRKLTEVARRCGVGYGTVYKLSRGEGNPTYDVLVKLSDYLEGAQ